MQFGQPGVPVLPPDGRMRFPGDESDGRFPDDQPLPPGMDDGTEDGTDDGTDGGSGGSSGDHDQQSGLAQG